jgi:ketosteroid isomerase-like protein
VVRTVAERNAQVARQTFEAICARDLDGLLELYDPDIEFQPLTGMQVELGGYQGHAGVRRYLEEAAEIWDEMLPHADDVRASGDHVVILGGCAVRGRGSGAVSDPPMAWLLTFRDGKVIRHRAYRTGDEALKAAGLSE